MNIRIVPIAALAAVLLLAVSVSVGVAEPAESTSDKPWAQGVSAEEQAVAFKLFDEGNVAFSERSYSTALRSYVEATEHWDHPAIRFNIAECYIRLDQPVLAFKNLKKALVFGAAALGPAIYERALTNQKLLDGQIAFLEVENAEPGAQASLDGEPLAFEGGIERRVLGPGRHQLVAKKKGFLTLTRDLSLTPGETTKERIKLVEIRTIPLVRRWKAWKPWVVASGGAVAVAAGIGLNFRARSNTDRFERYINEECSFGCLEGDLPASVVGQRDTADVQDVVSVSMIGLGTVALAAGVVMVIANQPHKQRMEGLRSREKTSMAPTVSGEGAGFVILGQF